MNKIYTQLELELGVEMNPNRNKSNRPRAKSDFYETPSGLAEATIKYLIGRDFVSPFLDTCILDPGCGNGIWAEAYNNVLQESFDNVPHYVYGIDINSPKYNRQLYYDFVLGDFTNRRTILFEPPDLKFDFIMGNPPFSLMEQFIKRSWELLASNGTIAFLGRLGFLGSQTRAKSNGLFRTHPLHTVLVSSRRPSFFSTVDGRNTTDMMEYAIFIWTKTSSLPAYPKIDWLLWNYEKPHIGM